MSEVVRRPAVAGMFYPADPAALERVVRAFLSHAPEGPGTQAAGVLLPHAGYPYSGSVAGYTLSRLFGGGAPLPDTVILLGPSHHSRARGVFMWSDGMWETPLGRVAVDAEAACRLAKACPAFTCGHETHEREHALEVLLPFLQALRPGVRIVPITVSRSDPAILARVGKALAREAEEQGAFLVVSSDMSHYVSAEKARALDSLALGRVEALDPGGLYATVVEQGISMCGVFAAVAALHAMRELKKEHARVVCYDTSGRTTGDMESVVGYAGALLGVSQ